MKLKQQFILRDIAGDTVLVPLTSPTDTFEGLITLNETGTFIWKQIENGKEEPQIVDALLEEYEIDADTAASHVAKLCGDLRKLGILE